MADPKSLTDEEIKKREDAAAQKVREELQAEIKKRDDEIAGFKDKDLNFGKVREQLETAQKEKGELETKYKESEGNRIKDIQDSVLETLVGKDPETLKKVTEAMTKITGDANDRTTITEKVQGAMRLAGVNSKGGGVRSVAGTGGSGGAQKPLDQVVVDTDVAAAAGSFNKNMPNIMVPGADGKLTKMNISEEDLKKAAIATGNAGN